MNRTYAILQWSLLSIGMVLCTSWATQTAQLVPELPLRMAPVWRPVQSGDVLGQIEIPSAGLTTTVREGTADDILAQSSGHFSGTALPGGLGNCAIAGHRDSVFRNLRHVTRGMDIIVTAGGSRYRYRVKTMRIVRPEEVEVLAASDEPVLTLITCYPFSYIGSAPSRFAVRASLVGIL